MRNPAEHRYGVATGAVLVALVGLAGGCSSHDDGASPTCTAPPVAVDRWKELLVVEPSVLSGDRSSNALRGPLSFARMIDRFAPVGMTPEQVIRGWFDSFSRTTQLGTYVTPARHFVTPTVLCPWQRATASNACNADCSVCAATTLDMSAAPFRLIALANRVDLHFTEDPQGAGESRLVYALTSGPADDPASVGLRMTVNFEFKNPTTNGRDHRYWYARWHALGSHAAFDDAFVTDLLDLYGEVTVPDPERPQNSWIGQVRTNEAALDWDWNMREFHLTALGLTPATTHNTPARELNNSKALADFVEQNRATIVAGTHSLPPSLTGLVAKPLDGRWVLPNVDDPLRAALASNTCDGCHQTEQADGRHVPIDANFHISALKPVGVGAVSPFLNNPAAPHSDELAARTKLLQDTLCAGR